MRDRTKPTSRRPEILGAALCALVVLGLPAAPPAEAQEGADGPRPMELMDVFDLEYASDPQLSPDGSRIVYERRFMDVMGDRVRSNLWILAFDGSGHRALTTGNETHTDPRWSPDGERLLYLAGDEDGKRQLWVRWMDTGQEAMLTHLRRSPGGISWSPDGEWIAFTMRVPEETESFAEMPPKPEGADWGPPIRAYESVVYRRDGGGFVTPGHTHVFVVPDEGGTPRQLTRGPYDHGGRPVWTPDGRHLLVSANRHEDAEYDPANTEIYEVSVEDGSVRALTSRRGPDGDPALSPDGERIAYTGFDDRYQGYQVTKLYVMNRDGTGSRVLAEGLDRDVQDPTWSADGRGLYFSYDDQGNTKLAFVSLDGEVTELASDVGGLSLGRPYAGGAFSVGGRGRFAFTHGRPDHPADVAAGSRGGGEVRRLTRLNRDLFSQVGLGEVEEIRWESSADGREIQGWILKPPGFDPSGSYPLVLEIHGGPFANYGDRFTAELQLYAGRGYVVLYTNPRGSTSYGEEFGNLIHHAYPGDDYHDLMSGVDAVLQRGYVDPDRLYVTGGSGGGVLSAWTVGHTDRFRAAAVQKPVINWYSWALTADMYVTGVRYWFPGPPWEHAEHYMERSPLSYVGNVTTPTMLITGEVDYRTPMSESEQFYQALKLQKVDAALVRIPDASHGIASRPSNLVAKVGYILGWFGRYGGGEEGAERPTAAGGG